MGVVVVVKEEEGKKWGLTGGGVVGLDAATATTGGASHFSWDGATTNSVGLTCLEDFKRFIRTLWGLLFLFRGHKEKNEN